MNRAHKIIKYVALAFALSIILSIINFGVLLVDTISNGINNNHKVSSEILKLEKDNTKSVLDIKVRRAKVKIVEGETLDATTDSKYVTIKKKNNTLIIREKKHSIKDKGTLTVTVPKDTKFDAVSIISGAGSFKASKISTAILDISCGVGKATFDNLIATKKATIEAGVGSFTISNGSLKNTDIELGVGSVSITAKLENKASIESGVGSVSLNLIGKTGDYSITAEKGLGTITLNGKEVSNDETYGTGPNSIDIEGGVGNIKINYKN